MSVIKVKQEENVAGDGRESRNEEMLDIGREVKEESDYGNLICIIDTVCFPC